MNSQVITTPASNTINSMVNPLQITTSAQQIEGKINFSYKVSNTSDSVIHVFDSERMPYVLLNEDGSLLVLYGVNSPDPNIDYNFIEIPVTKELQPGETLSGEVNLSPLMLANHYEKQRNPTEIHGQIKVQFQIGWGKTAIGKTDRLNMSINQLLDWQQLASGEVVEVSFP